jgi:hypothetical protein
MDDNYKLENHPTDPSAFLSFPPPLTQRSVTTERGWGTCAVLPRMLIEVLCDEFQHKCKVVIRVARNFVFLGFHHCAVANINLKIGILTLGHVSR